MKVSAINTNIITQDNDYLCQLEDRDIIEHLAYYKYLVVNQYISPARTATGKGILIIKRANTNKDVILKTNWENLDKVKTASALWTSVALPAILYGAEVIPLTKQIWQLWKPYSDQAGHNLKNTIFFYKQDSVQCTVYSVQCTQNSAGNL